MCIIQMCFMKFFFFWGGGGVGGTLKCLHGIKFIIKKKKKTSIFSSCGDGRLLNNLALLKKINRRRQLMSCLLTTFQIPIHLMHIIIPSCPFSKTNNNNTKLSLVPFNLPLVSNQKKKKKIVFILLHWTNLLKGFFFIFILKEVERLILKK